MAGMKLPPNLQRTVDEFSGAPASLRLPLLLEYADRVPPLPERFSDGAGMERVHECQTPFFLASELAEDGTVNFFFSAPEEAPTTRGFAGILHEGLAGLTPAEVSAVPGDFYLQLGLSELISPLRLRGLEAILGRARRQAAELTG